VKFSCFKICKRTSAHVDVVAKESKLKKGKKMFLLYITVNIEKILRQRRLHIPNMPTDHCWTLIKDASDITHKENILCI